MKRGNIFSNNLLIIAYIIIQYLVTTVVSTLDNTLPSCPQIYQYDIIKGQVNLIKLISGTSFYAVIDSKNSFILSDIDSGEIKSSFESFQDQQLGSNLNTLVTSDVVSKDGTYVYVVTSQSVTIRDLATMKDTSLQLRWQESYQGSTIKIFKTLPSNPNSLYFGAEYNVSGSPPAVIVAQQSQLDAQPPFSAYKIQIQPDPVNGPPGTQVSLLCLSLNVDISGNQYHIVVGSSGTNLYFAFIDFNKQGPTTQDMFWSLTISLPAGTQSIRASYFKSDTNELLIAIALPQNQQAVYSYNLSQFTKNQDAWIAPNPTKFTDQIINTINMMYYTQTSTVKGGVYFFGSQQNPTSYQLLFGSSNDFSTGTVTSEIFSNQITAIEYITGTSSIILGSSLGEIYHYNFITKVTTITKIPSQVDQYNSISTDSTNSLLMLSKTKMRKFNIESYTSEEKSLVLKPTITVVEQVIYSYTTIARVYIDSSLVGQPPNTTLQYFAYIEMQVYGTNSFSSAFTQLFPIQDIHDIPAFSITFLSQLTIAVAYASKDASALSIYKYTATPQPSISQATTLSSIFVGKDISLNSDSNNNIIATYGQNIDIYQYSSNVLTKKAINIAKNNQDISSTLAIRFLTGSNYLGVMKSPIQGQGELCIFSYDSTSLSTTFITSLLVDMQVSDIKYQSSSNIIVLYINAKYTFIKFDPNTPSLTSLLSTQTLGSKNGIDYFIGSSQELYIVQNNGIIKLKLGSTCLSQTCNKCQIETYFNVDISIENSSLSDTNGKGTLESPYNTQNKFFSVYYDIINAFCSVDNFQEIRIINYLQYGSRFNNQQYLYDIYDVYTSGMLGQADNKQVYANAVIQFIGYDSTPTSSSTLFYFYISNTISLPKTITSIYFLNVQFNQSTSFNGPMIKSNIQSITFDNIKFSTDVQTKVVNLQMKLMDGDELIIQNSVLQNMVVDQVESFIDVQNQMTITFNNVQLLQCNFISSSLIGGRNAMLKIINSIIDESIIKPADSDNQQLKFISFVSLFFDTFTFSNSQIENTLLFQNANLQGKDSQNIRQDIDITSFNFKNNEVSVKKQQSCFGFNVQFTEIGKDVVFSIQNSKFSSNNVSIISDPTQPSQDDNETVGEISQNYFILIEQVMSIILNTVDYIDNQGSGFMKGISTTSLDLTKITCSQTSTDHQINQASCLYLQEHNKLKLSIKDSNFENIYTCNSYVIQIITSSFTQVGANQYDSIVTISSTHFTNLKITTTSEFITGSVINYSTLQKDKITFDTVYFTNISLTTPTKVFSLLGSALSLYAPFSYFEQNNCEFTDFTSDGPKGPQEINVKQIKFNGCTYKNSNYNAVDYDQEGGFGKITARKLEIIGCTFSNSNALTGGALILIPTVAQADFKFTNTHFRMLTVQENAGAIHLQSATQKSSIVFEQCTFEYIFAIQEGGCIHLAYVLPTNDPITSYDDTPILTLNQNTITHVFSSSGSIVYAENVQINIDIMNVPSIDSNLITTTPDNISLSQIYSQFDEIGPLFAFTQCKVELKGSQFESLKIHSSKDIIQQTNFIVATDKAYVVLENININNVEFSDQNFILFTSSSLIIKTLNLSNALYKVQVVKQNRILDDMSNSVSNGISVIKIEDKSIIDATSLSVINSVCTNNKCYGGGVLLTESQGIITSSTFSNNQSEIGGGIFIYNPSGACKVVGKSVFDGNTAKKNGGGIFFQLVDSKQTLLIDDSTFTNNSGNQGGGIFIEYIDTTADSEPSQVTATYTTITNSNISSNKSNLFGGGIAYEGQYPTLDSATVIANNESKQKYGADKFSYPEQLKWDSEQTNSKRSDKIELIGNYDKVNNQMIYKLPNQQSGQTTIPLVFNLIDSSDCVIDNTYTNLLDYKVTSTISVADPDNDNIFLNPLTNTYSFNNYFNYTAIEISGIPGAQVVLNIVSNGIVDVGQSNKPFSLQLQYYLSYCVRGEVFKSFDVKTSKGTQTFYECLYCTEGTYSIIYPKLEDPEIRTCKKCSVDAFCPGGDVIELNEGYWRLNDHDDLLVSCENAPTNCLGGKTNSTCSEGHTGPLCESCNIEDGYTRAGNFQCASCGDVLINSLKVIGLMTFYVISAKMSVNGILGKIQEMWQQTNPLDAKIIETNASIVLKLFLNYIQIFMVMTTFNISIPKSFDSGVSSISSPTVQVLYSFECFFYQITLKTGINLIYLGLIFDLILPIVCVCLFIFTGFVSYRNNLFFRSFYIYTSLFYCLMYFQPNIFKDAISLVSCREIGKKNYIRYNVLYECGTEEYNKWTIRFVVPVLIVLVIVIPAILVWRIKANQNSKLGQRKFSFMTSEYVQKAYFWEIVKMNLKLLIMCSLTFFEHDIPNKIMSILFLVSLYAFMLSIYQPYKEELYNRIDQYSISVLIVSIYCGFIAFYNSDTFGVWLLAIIVILVINTIFVLWCINKLIMAYIPLIKTKQQGFFSSLLGIRYFRNKFFSKKTRVKFLYLSWMKSLIKQLKDMKLYNPISLKPERYKISYLMILKAVKEVNKNVDIQIVYHTEQEEDGKNSDSSSPKDNKKYLKILQITDSPFIRSQAKTDVKNEKDIILEMQ